MCAMLNTEQFHDMKYIVSFNSVNPELPLLVPPKKLLTPILASTPTFSDPLTPKGTFSVYRGLVVKHDFSRMTRKVVTVQYTKTEKDNSNLQKDSSNTLIPIFVPLGLLLET